MYIIILEDGCLVKTDYVTKEDFKASKEGIIDIIDITNPGEPLVYWMDGWTDVVFQDRPNAY